MNIGVSWLIVMYQRKQMQNVRVDRIILEMIGFGWSNGSILRVTSPCVAFKEAVFLFEFNS